MDESFWEDTRKKFAAVAVSIRNAAATSARDLLIRRLLLLLDRRKSAARSVAEHALLDLLTEDVMDLAKLDPLSEP